MGVADTLDKPWKVMLNDLIGGVSIYAGRQEMLDKFSKASEIDHRPVERGGPCQHDRVLEVGCFIVRQEANHIVELHNASLNQR